MNSNFRLLAMESHRKFRLRATPLLGLEGNAPKSFLRGPTYPASPDCA